jgi:AcrR family transcriptional regulator
MTPRIADDQILDAAVAAVLADGYAGATTRAIADAAGINEVTLFRRFGNKEQLVRSAIAREVGHLVAEETHLSGDLEADLLAVLEGYHATYSAHASLPLLVIIEATRNPGHADLLEAPLAAQRALREVIVYHQKTGELRGESPETAVRALIGPLLAYAVDVHIGVETGPPPAPRELLETFLGGHRAPAT